ncbi:hypothetical protein [Vibrio hyugaensis]|uniref:hypothetical protein n=1 Tax=Vibrio hyugaensis TaxID=1534743 RepID=UPI0015E2846E|nr:hypothetical protein [Vibrio hyugaensis]
MLKELNESELNIVSGGKSDGYNAERVKKDEEKLLTDLKDFDLSMGCQASQRSMRC